MPESQSRTPFHDLEEYLELPRVGGLVLSPDGSRLVATVSVLSADRTTYVSSLWSVDPTGERPSRRLTRSEKGESAPAFLPDGSLLFVSARRDGSEDDNDQAALWLMPADGGEPRRVLARPGGVASVTVAREAGTAVVTTSVLPGATAGDDAELRKVRKKHGVSAILDTEFPIRHWDHDLGPGEPHLMAVGDDPGKDTWGDLTDLTPRPGGGLHEASCRLLADGSAVVTSWRLNAPLGDLRSQVRVVDVATGETRVLLDDERYDYEAPVPSPDGQWVVARRTEVPTYDEPGDVTMVVVPTSGGEPRDLLPDFDYWPNEAAWSPSGDAVYVTIDDQGRGRVVRTDVESGARTVLTGDDAVYAQVRPTPDGQYLYALRAAVDEPPAPVRLDAREKDQQPVRLPAPAASPRLPGTLTEVRTSADDGQPLRAWLVLPEGADATDPAPLCLWVHGGPHLSWNQWQWRWNPWLMAAKGYAVLLPDPALSTGYGQAFHQRGWGRWGDRPYTDLMTVTDATVARPDIDAARTAAMGGSFGGYMSNWIAGHTDRFRAIVTHASLWALDQFAGTTDVPSYWQKEFGDPTVDPRRYRDHSPHRFLGSIRTPMLVIHGDRDYRVPVGEGLRLYWDLVRSGVEAQYLHFPDENHWVLKPGNVVAWYETVLAFLGKHVRGAAWQRPARV